MADENPNRTPPLPATIAYRNAGVLARTTRPTVLTFVGVISICLALGSLMIDGAAIWTVGRRMLLLSPDSRRAPTILPAPTLPPYAGDMRLGDGLTRPQREAVIAAIEKSSESAAPLSHDRRQMLRRLLCECGGRIFPSEPRPTSADKAKPSLLTARQLPAGRDGVRALGTFAFSTAAGTVLIDDSLARFIPASDASGPPVRIEGPYVCVPTVGGDGVPIRLARQTVEPALESLHDNVATGVTAMQARALAEWLVDSRNLREIQSSFITDPARERRSRGGESAGTSWTLADDSLHIEKAWSPGNGILSIPGPASTWILADGRMIEHAYDLNPKTLAPNWPLRPTATFAMLRNATLALVLLAVCDLLLLRCGVRILRNFAGAGRSLRFWVFARLLIVLAAAIPFTILGLAIGADLSNLLGGLWRPLAPLAAALAFILALQVVYQIFVLLTLRDGRAACAYYRQRGASTYLLPEPTRTRLRQRIDRLLQSRGTALTLAIGLIIACGAAQLLLGADATADGDSPAWWAIWPARMILIVAATIAAVVWFVQNRRGGIAVPAAAVLLILLTPTSATAHSRPALARPAGYDAAVQKLNEAAGSREKWRAIMNDWMPRVESGDDLTLYAMLSDRDADVRFRAAYALGASSMKHPAAAVPWIDQAVPRLLQLINNGNYQTSEIATRLLLVRGEAGMLDLIDLLIRSDATKRVALRAIRHADAALFTPDIERRLEAKIPQFFDFLSASNDSADPLLVSAVLKRLNPGTVQAALTQRIHDATRGERWMVELVKSLLSRGEKQDDLMLILIGKTDDRRLIDIAGSGRFSLYDPELKYLRRPLASSDPQVRRGAVVMVQKIGGPFAPEVADLLLDLPGAMDDPQVQAAAGMAVVLHGRAIFEEWTAQAVAGDEGAMRRLTIASHAKDLPESRRALQEPHSMDMSSFLSGASEKGQKAWVADAEPLWRMITSEDRKVRGEASTYLAQRPTIGPFTALQRQWIAAVAAGEDPHAARQKLELEAEAQATEFPSAWGDASSFAGQRWRHVLAGTLAYVTVGLVAFTMIILLMHFLVRPTTARGEALTPINTPESS